MSVVGQMTSDTTTQVLFIKSSFWQNWNLLIVGQTFSAWIIFSRLKAVFKIWKRGGNQGKPLQYPQIHGPRPKCSFYSAAILLFFPTPYSPTLLWFTTLQLVKLLFLDPSLADKCLPHICVYVFVYFCICLFVFFQIPLSHTLALTDKCSPHSANMKNSRLVHFLMNDLYCFYLNILLQ